MRSNQNLRCIACGKRLRRRVQPFVIAVNRETGEEGCYLNHMNGAGADPR